MIGRSHGQLGRFTTHDPVRRGCDHSLSSDYTRRRQTRCDEMRACFFLSHSVLCVFGCLSPAVSALFLADRSHRTIGRAFGTVCRLSSVCLSVVCNVLYCGKTVRPSEKVSEGVNRKPGSKSSFLGSPPYFYFRFRLYGHRGGRFCLIFARTAKQSVLHGRN